MWVDFLEKEEEQDSYGTLLLLATYDEDTDTFTSICKVGTGFTDEEFGSNISDP